MTDQIPAIRVTDPQSRDTVPENIGPNRSEGFDHAAGSRSASPKEGRHKEEEVTEAESKADRRRLRHQTINIRRTPKPWETASFAVGHFVEPRRARRKRQRPLVTGEKLPQ